MIRLILRNSIPSLIVTRFINFNLLSPHIYIKIRNLENANYINDNFRLLERKHSKAHLKHLRVSMVMITMWYILWQPDRRVPTYPKPSVRGWRGSQVLKASNQLPCLTKEYIIQSAIHHRAAVMIISDPPRQKLSAGKKLVLFEIYLN